MVKKKEPSEYDRLEELIRQLCVEYGLKLYVNGWTRKTFDVYREHDQGRRSEHLVRVESLATSNGEVQYFTDDAEAFATRLAAGIEEAFEVPEATLVRSRLPL